MKRLLFGGISLASAIALLGPRPMFAQLGASVPNWDVPSGNLASGGSGSSTHGRLGGMTTLGDVTNGIGFVGVTPCRVVDTRGAAGTFGGPALPSASPRNFPIPSGPCTGIPVGAGAYSLNVTVTQTLGPGFILMYPQGGVQPVVSTLNYVANQTVANAAIVPAGTGGGITVVAGVSGTHLIIDINGYYTQSYNSGNYFSVTSTCGSCLGVIFGHALDTTGVHYGGHFVANSTTDEAAGVRGLAGGATGMTAGLRGENDSSTGNARGVLGIINDTAPGGFSAGVRGINNGTGGNGIGVYG
ncbi:MAG: hypothetical protein ACRD3M_09105, partial [Thermoanaerobaculia bacterium]